MPIRPLRPLRTPLALFAVCAALHAGAATITVTSSADNATVDGVCTLREAIHAINLATPSADCPAIGSAWGTNDVIAFSIPGGGVQVIQPTTGLPALVRSVTVNGYTQPGAVPNTNTAGSYPNATGLNTQIRVELDGSLITGGATDGLVIGTTAASGSVVRGLAIVGFDTGIRIDTASSVYVSGNFIGWHANGTTRGSTKTGVWVQNAGNVVIGNSAAASRNLIAGTTGGQGVFAVNAPSLSLVGNLVGVDRDGTQGGATTGGAGISMQNLMNAGIVDNVVANHQFDGIYLYGVYSTAIARNTLGEGVGGVALGNHQRGIAIANSGTVVSTAISIHDNGIANSIDGIQVAGSATNGDPVGIRLDNNAIYGSSGLGIDLRPVGEVGSTVTLNDTLDADSGPNGLQNFPVITSAQVNANGSVTIAFTLDSTPGAIFDISAYANPACNAKGHGEGRHATGQVNTPTTTDTSGHAAGTVTVPTPLPAGWGAGTFVTLLAHQAGDSTSEFSACTQVSAAPGASTPPVMGDVPDQNGTEGTAFSLNLAPYVTPTDGDAVSDWAYTGMLPPGLSLNGGLITGIPTQAGHFTVQVRAGDKDGWSGYDPIAFTIAADPGNPGGPVAIPTLSEWGRLLAALLVGVAGFAALRRKPQG